MKSLLAFLRPRLGLLLLAAFSTLSSTQAQFFHGAILQTAAVGPSGQPRAHVGDSINATIRVRNNDDFEDSLTITNLHYVVHHSRGAADVVSSNLLTAPVMLTFFAAFVTRNYHYEVWPDDGAVLEDNPVAEGTDNHDGVDGSNIPQSFSVSFPEQVIILRPRLKVTVTAQPGLPQIMYGGTVSNTGNCLLTDVVVMDDSGTPGVPGDDVAFPIGNLLIGQSATWGPALYPATSLPSTNTVTASGRDALALTVWDTNQFTVAVPLGTAIPIANPGFETQVVADGFVVIGAPPSWSIYNPQNINGFSDAVGVINPAGTAHFPGGAAEGHNAAVIFMDGPASGEAGLQQTLAATLQAGRRYTLQVAVGNIASGTANFGYFNLAGFPGYRIDLLAGGTVIGSDSNSLAGSIPEGEFRTSQLVVTTGETNAALGGALQIRLVNLNQPGPPMAPGIEVNFDQVRLTEEPRRPELTLRRGAGNTVELVWVDVSSQFVLQSTDDLAQLVWQDVPQPTPTNGTNRVTLSKTNSAAFFRLLAPE